MVTTLIIDKADARVRYSGHIAESARSTYCGETRYWSRYAPPLHHASVTLSVALDTGFLMLLV